MQHWAIISSNGQYRLVCTAHISIHPADDGEAAACENCRVIPIAGAPLVDEVLDTETGEIQFCAKARAVENARRVIDSRADAALTEIHRLKEAEARLLLSGAPPGPFLTHESAALGMQANALANQIVERADQYRARLHEALAVVEAHRRSLKQRSKI